MGRYITSCTRVREEEKNKEQHLHLMITTMLIPPSCMECVVLLREGVVVDRRQGRAVGEAGQPGGQRVPY